MSSHVINLEKPLIVIGAGRSGTTMIRETLVQHKDIAGFQYEMNYLWRFGNDGLSHDALNPEIHLNPKIKRHIRSEFSREAIKQGKSRVLDKTVANVMRPLYIQHVLPESKILHVIRDGRAVSASAMKRWAAPQPPGYFASKLKTVPVRSLPVVAIRYMRNKLLSNVRQRSYRQSWGSRWEGIDEAVVHLPLAQVCARQWVEQVNHALNQKRYLAEGSYMEVRYEQLVSNPREVFNSIQKFFELPQDDKYDSWVRSMIDSDRTSKWKSDLEANDMKLVEQEAGDLLKELGYI